MFGIFIGIILALAIVIAGYLFNQRALATVSAIAVFVLNLAFQSFTVISAGHTGVQVTMGEVNLQALTEGVHFVNPISKIRDVDVRLQRANLNGASAGTKDMQ